MSFLPTFLTNKDWICCVTSWLALSFTPPWLLWTAHLIQSPLNYMEVFSIHFTRGVKWGFISSGLCTKPFKVHFYGMGCTASYFSLQKCQCWGQKGMKLRNWSLLKISFSGWAKNETMKKNVRKHIGNFFRCNLWPWEPLICPHGPLRVLGFDGAGFSPKLGSFLA